MLTHLIAKNSIQLRHKQKMSGRDKGEKRRAGGVNHDRWRQNVTRVILLLSVDPWTEGWEHPG